MLREDDQQIEKTDLVLGDRVRGFVDGSAVRHGLRQSIHSERGLVRYRL
jgi:hypothetical protein